ncbi:hypothetical protein Pcac1_g627 [Phytophthora cactorum]|nr:hypothetical protein Pcac1_g627 [Phytophthora cactorum]
MNADLRNTEDETRIKEKAEFTKSKAGFQQHTTQWNNDMAHWAESVGGIEEAISRRRISKELTKCRVPTWMNDKDRACCHLHLKPFTNTRRNHHCRACGEIIYCMDGTSTTAAGREKEEANLAADAANEVTADGVALPEGEENSILRDAVKQSHY